MTFKIEYINHYNFRKSLNLSKTIFFCFVFIIVFHLHFLPTRFTVSDQVLFGCKHTFSLFFGSSAWGYAARFFKEAIFCRSTIAFLIYQFRFFLFVRHLSIIQLFYFTVFNVLQRKIKYLSILDNAITTETSLIAIYVMKTVSHSTIR